MAIPKRTAAGSWRVQLFVRGVRDAATFATKREAVEWAAQRKAPLPAKQSSRGENDKTGASPFRVGTVR